MSHLRRILPFLLIPMPLAAQEAAAQSVTLEFGLYAAVGFFGAVAIIVFVTGFIIYVTRLGTERREHGIKIMEKGMVILMVVVLATAALYWLEK
jgi:H+/gluconate symporter-like permease